jgi:hypothetical protein
MSGSFLFNSSDLWIQKDYRVRRTDGHLSGSGYLVGFILNCSTVALEKLI